jgi:hypothetical protein
MSEEIGFQHIQRLHELIAKASPEQIRLVRLASIARLVEAMNPEVYRKAERVVDTAFEMAK